MCFNPRAAYSWRKCLPGSGYYQSQALINRNVRALATEAERFMINLINIYANLIIFSQVIITLEFVSSFPHYIFTHYSLFIYSPDLSETFCVINIQIYFFVYTKKNRSLTWCKLKVHNISKKYLPRIKQYSVINI